MDANNLQAPLFINESRIIFSSAINTSVRVSEVNKQIAEALKEWWIQFGQPFSLEGTLCVNLVKFDERLTGMMEKMIGMLTTQLDQMITEQQRYRL
jgi:hypothetical protein